MRLPDFAKSRAVVSGTAKYEDTDLENLPSAAKSVREFRRVLLAPALAGFPEAACTQIIDPNDPGDLLGPLRAAAIEAEDLFLFYFCGHGLLLDEGRLHLALTRTREGEFWTAVPFESVAQIVRESRARTKVLILDCCYSGKAMESMMGSNAAQAAGKQLDIDVEGLYVMTSSSATKASLAPKSWPYTAFTAALIATMTQGIASGEELLPLERLYDEVRVKLRQQGLPEPQQYNRNNAGKMALVVNLDDSGPTQPAVDLDLSNSSAVVVGTEHYESSEFRQLHSATNDALQVAETLGDPQICGITHLSHVTDPTSFDAILEPVQRAAREAQDNFVLYLSGHSWITPDGELELVLSSSDPNRPWTMLPLHYLSEALRSSRAAASVVIAETSYAMRMAQSLDLGTNLYFIAAAGPNSQAFVDGRHGDLTRRILSVLRTGVDHAAEHLTPLDLFQAVEMMPGQSEPRLAIHNANRPPCLFRNRSNHVRKEPEHRCG